MKNRKLRFCGKFVNVLLVVRDHSIFKCHVSPPKSENCIILSPFEYFKAIIDLNVLVQYLNCLKRLQSFSSFLIVKSVVLFRPVGSQLNKVLPEPKLASTECPIRKVLLVKYLG